ncbi:RHS repeat-associated core domain-containing protein [Vibrio penaeicida]|uniref:RHS repeat-associated core domain-containing protein n=1 Tax=Vibrio penaeicida TaxID=104609 RepID=UPI00273323D3|nr:RHS repeat-associated core domain-containing protein [Vibrio penaeicida]MDP2571933.1 RHS repeat-associated core domain-containing protein [Vibrio penaeicida]
MSQDRKTQLMSSAEAAEQNFSTDNVLSGGCVECGCEVFIRYHYDDEKPVPNAPFILKDSNGTEIEGNTDDKGLCKIENMGCGGFELLLDEGSDEFSPEEAIANNPSLQHNPIHAAIAGEYFSLYSILSREKILTYDKDDSSDAFIDIDDEGWFGTWSVEDKYDPAYKRFWALNEKINKGPKDLRVAVQNIHTSLAAEVAGQSQDNSTILLFCQIALGFVPVVGQAMDLYDLGDWGWKTYEGNDLDTWHWASGALIGIGFVPGLGDAVKKTGNAVIDALRKSDSAAIQLAIKTIRSLSNGNVVKYLSNFGSKLQEYGKKAVDLIDKIIAGLVQALKDGASWIIRLMKDAFQGMIDAMRKLSEKVADMVSWLTNKVKEFIGKVVTRVTGTAKKKGSANKAENTNAGANRDGNNGQGNSDKSSDANDKQSCNSDGPCVDDPISTATGKVIEQRDDFALPGFLPITHSRYYHSVGRMEVGLLGSAWRSVWDTSLTLEEGIITFVDQDYSVGIFPTPTDEKPTQSELKPEWRLYRTNEEFVLQNKDRQRLHFAHAVGNQIRLTKISDSYGNQTHFLYEMGTLKWVVLSDQKLIEVHTQNRRIQKLDLLERDKHFIQTLATYQYDKRGRLLSVRASEGRNFDYQYSDEGWLTRWDDLSNTWVEHDYDEKGRATKTRCSGGYWEGQLHYDDDNNITSHKSAFGGISQYFKDDKNRIIAIVDPEGNRTDQEWNFDNLTAVTDPLGQRTEYEYDDWGNVTQVTEPNGQVHTYSYDENGQLLSYSDPLASAWHYAYNSAGSLVSVQDPDSREWRHEYNALGQRTLTALPDGSETRYGYNPQGMLERVSPDNSVGFTFYYDKQCRLVKRTSDEQLTRRWYYKGNSLSPYQVEYEDGSKTQFEYDIEGNITAITDALGNVSRYDYGAFDKLASATDPLGATTHYHYNVETEFAGVTNSKGHQWRYEFDALGRVKTERHYDGRKHHFGYDAASRIVSQTKPNDHVLQYDYNEGGQLAEIQTLDHEGNATSKTWFEYDEASRLLSAENGDAWVGFEYNASGQVIKETLNGQTLTHRYDSAGIRQSLEGANTPLELLWQKGQLQQLGIGSHQPLNFSHNNAGFETLRDNQNGFRLHHQWGKTGLLEHQQLGFLNEQTADLTAQPRDRYLLRKYQYDALDRLVGIDESYFGKTDLRLNSNGQISEVRQTKSWKDKATQVQLFGYDSELNLNQQSTLPLADNVIDLAQKREEKNTHQYDRAGRVEKKGPYTYRYDECGRVIEKIEQQNGYRAKSTKFIWNAFDQLIKVELPNQERWRYRYDPFGRRIAKECEQSQTKKANLHYLWDGDNLIQQQKVCADGTALSTIEWVYEPDSFRPLAQINTDNVLGTSALSYVVTDHAGTPRELCSEQGDIIWRGQHEIWGGYKQQHQQGLLKKYASDVANDPIECDLRYQGQIYDRETGLYYNRHRYYDTDSGQYLSSDPIGFAGGLRPQAYVHNPMDWVDPLGLASLFDLGTYSGLNGGAHVGDGLQAHELIRHEFLKQQGLAGDSRLGGNPSIALDLDHHTRGPRKDSRGIGGVHYHENIVRGEHGLGKNQFKSTIAEELDITSEAMRRAGVPEESVSQLRKNSEEFYEQISKSCK